MSRCQPVARDRGSSAAAADEQEARSRRPNGWTPRAPAVPARRWRHGAAKLAGQRLKPACRIHCGADHREFEPVEADISEHDRAVMQADAEPDRRLAAALRSLIQCADRADHGLRAAQRVPASESLANGVPNVAISPSPRYLSSVPPCRNTSRSIRSWNCRSVPMTSIGSPAIRIGGEIHDVGKQHRNVLGVGPA